MRKFRLAIESARNSLVFTKKDMSAHHSDAWVYGILVGWGQAFDSICKSHQWPEFDKKRLKSYADAVDDFLNKRKYFDGLWVAINNYVKACGGDPYDKTKNPAKEEAMAIIKSILDGE